MKGLIKYVFLLLACPVFGQAVVFTSGVNYTSGAPTHNPGKANSRVAIDTVTWLRYEHVVGTTWTATGYAWQEHSGCTAPSATPTKHESIYKTNTCSPPKMYKWTGAAWEEMGGAGSAVITASNALYKPTSTSVKVGGPLVENTNINGKATYTLTLDSMYLVTIKANRTSGTGASRMTMGTTNLIGVDIVHYNPADLDNIGQITANFNTGNIMSLANGSLITSFTQYLSGGNYRSEWYASNGSSNRIIELGYNDFKIKYLERQGIADNTAYAKWDTITGEMFYQSPDIVATEIAASLSLGRVDAVADSTAFRAYTRNGFDVVIMADSLRGGKFRRCYSCTADQYMTFTDASGRKWERIDFKAVSVKWFGAKGDGTTNDSLAIQKAFNTVYDVWFPPGVYKCGTHTISYPKRVFGNNAVLKQASLSSSHAVILTILADNVTVEGLEFRGQISTQTSEFSHGLVIGNQSGAGVKNTIIRNVKIRDTRGDGIMVASQTDHCSNVTISNVETVNTYRNGIAVIAGEGISITGYTSDSTGLASLDLEPDLLAQSTKNVHVSGVKVSNFWVGHHLDTLAENITLTAFEIDGNRHGSNPVYPAGSSVKGAGIITRNTRSFLVSNGVIRNCEGYALYFSTGSIPSSNIKFDNVVFEGNNSAGSYASSTKIIAQDESNSDSSAAFVNCYFDGGGITDQVGLPTGSLVKNCTITGFERLMISSFGKHHFEGCRIKLSDDLIYDSNGGASFDRCRISCSYLLRGQNGDYKIYKFTGDTITTSVTPLPYTFFGATPVNTRFVLKGNIINGAATQPVANGGTIFHDNATVSGTGAATVILPDLLRRPENIITVNNLTDGRAITFDPDGSTTINGSSTAVTQTNTTVTCDNSNWYTRKDGPFSVVGSNGTTVSTTAGVATVKLGSNPLVENTTINGVSTYGLTLSNLGSGGFKSLYHPALFSTDNGAVGIKILGDITANPTGTLATTDESFIATTSGGSGLYSQYGALLFASRTGNEIRFTINRTSSELTLSPGVANFIGRGEFSANLFIKNNGKITNINTFGTNPVYKDSLTWQGGMWISDGGDAPLILRGRVTAFPPTVGTDVGAFIGTSGGGSSGTPFYNYGNLIIRPRAGLNTYILSGSMPVLNVGSTGVGVGTGLATVTDTLHVDGTVRLESLPAVTTETDFLMANSLGQVAQGPLPDGIVTPANLEATGVTAGDYGAYGDYYEFEVNAGGQIVSATQVYPGEATYLGDNGGTGETVVWQPGDIKVKADPTAGNLEINLSGSMKQGVSYDLFGCCNATYSIVINSGNIKLPGNYGTVTTYTLSAGEHLEIIRLSDNIYYVKK